MLGRVVSCDVVYGELDKCICSSWSRKVVVANESSNSVKYK